MTADTSAAEAGFVAIPEEVRALLEAPNYVHLSTLRLASSTPARPEA